MDSRARSAAGPQQRASAKGESGQLPGGRGLSREALSLAPRAGGGASGPRAAQ
jgi:hypothetical protein